MKLEKYTEQVKRLPGNGKQIIGNIEDHNIVVYQAFNPQIAEYAVRHQKIGGEHYSFARMSWIKPGFLWMMYRAGWASKEHQERILAITISMDNFKKILSQATISSYSEDIYKSHEEWKNELGNTEVRLQWDPDHDPFGNKQERKAIQLGMKGEILRKFCTEWVVKIEDITDFVKSGFEKVKVEDLENLEIPFEEIIRIDDLNIIKRLSLTQEQENV